MIIVGNGGHLCGEGYGTHADLAERSGIAPAHGIDDLVDLFARFSDRFLHHVDHSPVELRALPRVALDGGEVSGVGNGIHVQDVHVVFVELVLMRFDVCERAFQSRFFRSEADIDKLHSLGHLFGMLFEIFHYHHIQTYAAHVVHGAGAAYGLVLGQEMADKEKSGDRRHGKNV